MTGPGRLDDRHSARQNRELANGSNAADEQRLYVHGVLGDAK